MSSYGDTVRRAVGGLKAKKKRRVRVARGHSAAHPGFRAVAEKIAARQGISEDRAGAILAASSRRASPAAKARNPRLKRVKGGAY